MAGEETVRGGPEVAVPTPAWNRVNVEPDVEIAYLERGAGQALVLVPGWTMSGEVFEHQLDGLSSQFRVVTFDPRSQGRSTYTATGNTYPQQGLDLAALITALELGEVHLVGWSYGALAAYAYVEQSGLAGLRSFTAIDTTPKPLGSGAPGEWAEETLDGFLEEVIGPFLADPTGFADTFASWLLDRDPEPEERDWLAKMHLSTERHATASLQVSAMFCDYRGLAERLGGQVPIANAVRTNWIDEAEPWLAENVPGSVLWPIDSHLAFWDRPDDFNSRLVEFLHTGS